MQIWFHHWISCTTFLLSRATVDLVSSILCIIWTSMVFCMYCISNLVSPSCSGFAKYSLCETEQTTWDTIVNSSTMTRCKWWVALGAVIQMRMLTPSFMGMQGWPFRHSFFANTTSITMRLDSVFASAKFWLTIYRLSLTSRPRR